MKVLGDVLGDATKDLRLSRRFVLQDANDHKHTTKAILCPDLNPTDSLCGKTL